MVSKKNKNALRKSRAIKVRSKVKGTPERPRLSVYRSLTHIYAQVIDDVNGVTLVSSSTTNKELAKKLEGKTKIESATMVGEAVAKLAIPTVVSQIIVILYSLADTFFIGQIGDPNQLAALSITFPIYTLLTAVANLFGIGANSVISRSMGQNDEETAKKKHHHFVFGEVLL